MAERGRNEEVDEDIDEDVLKGLEIVEGRITEETKKGYGMKIKAFKKWCFQKHGDRSDIFENREKESIQLKKPNRLPWILYEE